MKLSRELSKRGTGKTIYILDEPTTGLHFDDIRKLIELLQEWARWAELRGAGEPVPLPTVTIHLRHGRDFVGIVRSVEYVHVVLKLAAQRVPGRAPTSGEAHWTLGLILEQQGRKQEASSEIKTAFRLRPDLDGLKRN